MLIINSREEPPKKHVRTPQGTNAGVSLVSTMIQNYHQLFTRYNEDEVPEIILKSIRYLEERGKREMERERERERENKEKRRRKKGVSLVSTMIQNYH